MFVRALAATGEAGAINLDQQNPPYGPYLSVRTTVVHMDRFTPDPARRAGTGCRGPRNTRSGSLGLGDHQNTAHEVYTAPSTQILTTLR